MASDEINTVIRTARLREVHKFGFRPGEWGKIIGIYLTSPGKKYEPRLSYQIMYDDGVVSYMPIMQNNIYEIE